jgi:hypothetical protein
MHFFVEYVSSRIPGNWKKTSSGWIVGNCPVCTKYGQPRPDRKRRGGIQLHDDSWGYHCFNCKVATRWQPGHLLNDKQKDILKGFGCSEHELQRVNIELMREHETAQLLNPTPSMPAPFEPDWPTTELPEGSQMIGNVTEVTPGFEAALQTIVDRHLAHHTDWAYSSAVKFRRRVILPYRYQGRVVGYTARHTGILTAGTPKYIVQRPKGFVFNLDRQNSEREFVIVTEGDFDALTLDGVALGSNSVSHEQASLIRQLCRHVILLPDADRAGRSLIEPAIREGWSVSFPEWMDTHKDANSAAQEYGRLFVLRSTIDAAVTGPSKIRVMAKRLLTKD